MKDLNLIGISAGISGYCNAEFMDRIAELTFEHGIDEWTESRMKNVILLWFHIIMIIAPLVIPHLGTLAAIWKVWGG